MYPQSKGQTEERLSQAGFSKVSIFRPGMLEVVEPRLPYRPVEGLLGVLCKFNNTFNLHIAISVARVGMAMRLAATSPSSVPVKPTTNEQSGSAVYAYSNKDMDNMTAKI